MTPETKVHGRGKVFTEVRQPAAETQALVNNETRNFVPSPSLPLGSSGTRRSGAAGRGRGRGTAFRVSPTPTQPGTTCVSSDWSVGKCLIESAVPAAPLKRNAPVVTSTSPTHVATTALPLSSSSSEPSCSSETDSGVSVSQSNGTSAPPSGTPATPVVDAQASSSSSPSSSSPVSPSQTTAPQATSSGDSVSATSSASSASSSSSSLPASAVHAELFLPQRSIALPAPVKKTKIKLAVPKTWLDMDKSSKVALKHLLEVVRLAVNQPLKWRHELDSLWGTLKSWISSREVLLEAVRFVIAQAMEFETFAENGTCLLGGLVTVYFKDAKMKFPDALQVCVQEVADGIRDMLADDTKRQCALKFASFLGCVNVMLKENKHGTILCSSILVVLFGLLDTKDNACIAAACNLLKKTGECLYLGDTKEKYNEVKTQLSAISREGGQHPVSLRDLILATLRADWERTTRAKPNTALATPSPLMASPMGQYGAARGPYTPTRPPPGPGVAAPITPYATMPLQRGTVPFVPSAHLYYTPRPAVHIPASMSWVRPSLTPRYSAASTPRHTPGRVQRQ